MATPSPTDQSAKPLIPVITSPGVYFLAGAHRLAAWIASRVGKRGFRDEPMCPSVTDRSGGDPAVGAGR